MVSVTNSKESGANSQTLEFSEDPICAIMDMLNVKVVSKSAIQENNPSNNFKSWEEEQQHNDLLMHNLMLTRDVTVAREDCTDLTKRLLYLTSELQTMQFKNHENQKRLSALDDFTKELKYEFGNLLQNLSKFLMKAKSKENSTSLEHSEFIEFLKLLDELGCKIPDIQESGWDIAKGFFTLLNDSLGCKPSNNTNSTTEPKDNDQLSVSSDKATSTTKDGGEDDEIEILEENIRPSVNNAQPSQVSGLTQSWCCFCGALFPNPKILVEHASLLHNGCCVCRRLYGTKHILAEHIKQFHCSSGSLPENATISQNNTSSNANPPSTTFNVVTAPMNYGTLVQPEILSLARNQPTQMSTGSTVLSSTLTNRENVEPNAFQNLVVPQHGITNLNLRCSIYECICGEKFANQELLKKHMASVSKTKNSNKK